MSARLVIPLFNLLILSLSNPLRAEETRDHILIVGSTTVYPFVASVAERFGSSGTFATPIVEQTGTGGGLEFFCKGAGMDTPDVANASRPIKDSEKKRCAANGVGDITEIKIGFDGIVLANAKDAASLSVTVPQLLLAIAKHVPVRGALAANPYKKWSDIDPALPEQAIEIYGPPDSSGTYDALRDIVLLKGCESFPEYAKAYPDEEKRKEACEAVRDDGAYVKQREDDNVVVQKILSNPNSFGIFGYSYLEENLSKVKAAKINTVAPTFENIADGAYPVARSLFVYVKNGHIGRVPGIAEFLDELTSEAAFGDQGYLADEGLIPLTETARERQRAKVQKLKAPK